LAINFFKKTIIGGEMSNAKSNYFIVAD